MNMDEVESKLDQLERESLELNHNDERLQRTHAELGELQVCHPTAHLPSVVNSSTHIDWHRLGRSQVSPCCTRSCEWRAQRDHGPHPQVLLEKAGQFFHAAQQEATLSARDEETGSGQPQPPGVSTPLLETEMVVSPEVGCV